jgi:arsenate reductase
MVKKVLFACIKNAGRSQMANALFNSMCHAEDAVSISAGTEPADHVHANVAELLMQEKGLDISKAEPTKLTAELATGMDILVTVRAPQRNCSSVFSARK